MVSLKLKTAPTEDPVSVTEAKEYLRVDGSDEDSRILTMIKAATLSLENYCDQKFIEQTWIEYHDAFPMASAKDWWDGTKEMAISEIWSQAREIKLSLGRVVSLVAVKTYADDNVAILMDPSTYQVDTAGDYGRLALRIGETWPTTILRKVNGVEIEYVVGLAANAAALSQNIKQAVLEFVGHMYEHRGDEKMAVPSLCLHLMEPFKRFKLRC